MLWVCGPILRSPEAGGRLSLHLPATRSPVVEPGLPGVLPAPSLGGLSPWDRRNMSHSPGNAARPLLPLWTSNLVHTQCGKRGESPCKASVVYTPNRSQIPGTIKYFFFFPPEKAVQRRLFGGGDIGADKDYGRGKTQNSKSTTPGKCRRAEHSPVGLENRVFFQGKKSGQKPWQCPAGSFPIYLGIDWTLTF